MARKEKKRLLRSPAILSVAFVVLLAMSGLVYAHWTKTLDLHVDINTGNVDLAWSAAFTDDDGVVNDPAKDATDGVPSALYTHPQFGSGSTDPSSQSFSGGPFSTRYDKDVARCFTNWEPFAMSFYTFLENAYPSYWCTLFTDVTNTGSVPVKATALRVEVMKNGADVTPFVNFGTEPWELNIDPADDPWIDLVFEVEEGILCGTQIDPGESIDVSGWFHIEQGAMQSANYSIWLEQDFVNWNEWTPDLCTFNGFPLP